VSGGPETRDSPDATIKAALARVVAGEALGQGEMAAVIGAVMDGAATPAQIGGLLVALRVRGETADELAGAATAMRARATPLALADPARGVDTCGTGGDGAGTVNVSTLAAILVAGMGGLVAKHGNRAVSSRAGSADVLEALGVAVDASPALVARCLDAAGIGFLFAPRFHAATRHAAGVRRELGLRTIFNLLGPLTNPAAVRHQVVGVFAARWCAPVAAALGALGVRRAAVVHGADGLDEVAVRGPTHVAVVEDGAVRELTVTPRDFGLPEADPAGLAGGDAATNAAVLRLVLAGREVGAGGPRVAVLHAAAMTAGLARALLDGPLELAALPAATARAIEVATGGAGRLVLHRWQQASDASADLGALAGLRAADFAGAL
jgi:anthranilate phosphoribosyltransferase